MNPAFLLLPSMPSLKFFPEALRATRVVFYSDTTPVGLYRIDMLLSTMSFIGL